MSNFISFMENITKGDECHDYFRKNQDSLALAIPENAKRDKMWMPTAAYIYSFGTKTIDVTLFLDKNKDIQMASVMTDQFYQSPTGESEHKFFIWTRPCDVTNENISLPDRKGTKQNLDALYYVDDMSDLTKVACAIINNQDIPVVDMKLSVNMATRMMFRRYLRALKNTQNTFNEIGCAEMKRDHLIWMCEHVLKSNLPLDKMNRWLGFVQAAIIVSMPQFSVNDERNFSRPLFHMAYKTEGVIIPETKNP